MCSSRLLFLLLFASAIPATFSAGKVPSQPLNVKAELLSPNTVRVSWEPPKTSNGQLKGFYVYKQRLDNGNPVGTMEKVVHIADSQKRHTDIADLEPNREFSFRVNAFNRNGDGEFSETAVIVTGGIPPKPPEILGVKLLSPVDEPPLRAMVEWKSPELKPLEALIDRYHIYYKAGSSSEFKVKTTEKGDANSTIIEGLRMAEIYEIRVAAENVDGASENATEQLETPTGVPDSEPLHVKYEIVDNKMRLSWEPPPADLRHGTITHYTAILTPMDSEKRMEKNVTSQFVDFDISPHKSYTFKVSASTMKGPGPLSPILTIIPDPQAFVAQPTNIRVQATSNSSVVVQWEYEGEQPVDSFVVRYMHEPTRGDMDRWQTWPIASPTVRHVIIDKLNSQKPYAFCVLAVSQSRQGSCSDPWTTIERVTPVYMVQNLHVAWKTQNSAQVKWDYNGPQPVRFYVNSTGRKEYLDQALQNKSMQAPGYREEVDGSRRDKLFTTFRPYMRYTIHVGVETLPPGPREYWPAEIVLMTEPAGPPIVDVPVILDTPRIAAGMVPVELHPSSEEYGPISHYWLIVMPGNYTQVHVMNLEALTLEQNTRARAAAVTRSVTAHPARKRKRQRENEEAAEDAAEEVFDEDTEDAADRAEQLEGRPVKRSRRQHPEEHAIDEVHQHNHNRNHRQDEEEEGHHRRSRRSYTAPAASIQGNAAGPYITARINAEEMQKMHRQRKHFVIGDGMKYNSYVNFALEPPHNYRVMMRAFAKSSRPDFTHAPQGEHGGAKLYTDSMLTEPFTPKGGPTDPAQRGNIWILGPIGVLAFLGVLILALLCWWLRCNRKSAGRNGSMRHGSITKVALGTHHHLNGNGNGAALPSETSKLLGNDYATRTAIMQPYEQLNGKIGSSLEQLYPLPGSASHSRGAMSSSNGNVSGYTVPCLPSSGGVIGGHSLSHPPVPITELATHIERLRGNNNAGFVQEFESIETGQQFTWDASSADCNKHKNRYANVVAYDHSRVILTALPGYEGSDYINANYIDGYQTSRAYIATQGPLPETFDDFWRMVWEEGSATIVMLTNLEENSRIKCDQYWPSSGRPTMYGYVEVTLIETIPLAHYTMRTLRIAHTHESGTREIRHLQYTAWPDHGVPDHPTPFLMFLKRVKTLNPANAGPIVSHCSAGIGRTGAFIVIDCMLERLRYEHTVDIFGCVTALRAQRTYMVQIDDQYMFIHDAVLDAVLSGSTEVPAKRLQQHVAFHSAAQPADQISPMEQEFRQLSTFRLHNASCTAANAPVNRNKNRVMGVVPYDSNRVELSPVPGMDGSDYINASWIDGYRERLAYIATQAPSEQTTVDFWRLVWEHEVGIVVTLKMCYDGTIGREYSQSRREYWPLEAGIQMGQLVIEPIAEYNMPSYILREFKISDLMSQRSRTLRHFEYTDWPEMSMAPRSIETFLDLVQQVHMTKAQFGVDGPIVVHCSTGAGRTAVFLALAQILERIRLEHVVDVFTTVKLLCTERQGMVPEKEQYHFLYMAACEFLSGFDHAS